MYTVGSDTDRFSLLYSYRTDKVSTTGLLLNAVSFGEGDEMTSRRGIWAFKKANEIRKVYMQHLS